MQLERPAPPTSIRRLQRRALGTPPRPRLLPPCEPQEHRPLVSSSSPSSTTAATATPCVDFHLPAVIERVAVDAAEITCTCAVTIPIPVPGPLAIPPPTRVSLSIPNPRPRTPRPRPRPRRRYIPHNIRLLHLSFPRDSLPSALRRPLQPRIPLQVHAPHAPRASSRFLVPAL